MSTMNGFCPIEKRPMMLLEGVKLQNKLFRIFFLHIASFLICIALETTSLVMIKHGTLAYLAWYCRQNMFLWAIALYLVLLVSTGVYGICNLTELAIDKGAITVYFVICFAQILFTHYLTEYLINYYKSTRDKKNQALLGHSRSNMYNQVQ